VQRYVRRRAALFDFIFCCGVCLIHIERFAKHEYSGWFSHIICRHFAVVLGWYEFVPRFTVYVFNDVDDVIVFDVLYSLRTKLYDVLSISHILRNTINNVWKRDIISCFIKLSLINNMRKINERIERRESNK